MITVTPSAAQQIRIAATQSMPTRWACASRAARRRRLAALRDGLRRGPRRRPRYSVRRRRRWSSRRTPHLLDGLTLDYVEYEAGDFRFIFINPNDAAVAAPHRPTPAPRLRRRRWIRRGAGCARRRGCGCGGR